MVTQLHVTSSQGNPCATSPGFRLRSAEIAAIVPYFSNPSGLTGKECSFAGEYYLFADGMLGNEMYFRKGKTGRRCPRMFPLVLQPQCLLVMDAFPLRRSGFLEVCRRHCCGLSRFRSHGQHMP